MAKRYILSVKEIYKRRAAAWEYHYSKRETVKNISPALDIPQIMAVINNLIPPPELLIDGSLLRGMPHIEGTHAALDKLHWSFMQREILCIWYWSAEGWQEFVRAWQALPDVYAAYVYVVDAKLDAIRFEPRKTAGSKRRELDHSARIITT